MIEKKRMEDKKVVGKMITIYCRNNHKVKVGLCNECEDLRQYAFMRTDKCPFMETKTFCSYCKVHCYKPEMQEKIRRVMAYSGKRLIFINPILSLKHALGLFKNKNKEILSNDKS